MIKKLFVAVLGLAFAGSVLASEYIESPDTSVVKSGTKLCWKTDRWTPADATEECDPQYIKKEEPTPVAVKMELSADTLFDFDKSKLKDTTALDGIISELDKMELDAITVVAHTDSVGTIAYNQKLSERRAESVKSYMVSNGIDGEKIVTEGKGELEPVADNKTKEGRRLNRRATVTIMGVSKQQ